MSRKRKLKYRIGKLRLKLQDTWKSFFTICRNRSLNFFGVFIRAETDFVINAKCPWEVPRKS
jgi:hypothetical protein